MDEIIREVIVEEADDLVPDEVDLWPQIANRVADQRKASARKKALQGATGVRSPFSVAESGQSRLRLPQLTTLFDGAGRLAGVLLLMVAVVWFALTLRDGEHFAADIRTAPAGVTAIKPERELLFIVTPASGILVLDPSTLAEVGNISLDVTEGPAVGPNGDLYFIADFHNLIVLEIATGLQRVITTVTDPLRTQTRSPDRVLAVTPEGRRIVVSHYWTPPEGGVAEEITEFWRTVVDVESGALLATIPETREHVVTSDTASCLGAYMFPAPDNRKLYGSASGIEGRFYVRLTSSKGRL